MPAMQTAETTKAPVQKKDADAGANASGGPKSQLRGQSYDDGAAALAPVQMKNEVGGQGGAQTIGSQGGAQTIGSQGGAQTAAGDKGAQAAGAPASADAAAQGQAAEQPDWRDEILKNRDSLVNGAKVEKTPGPAGSPPLAKFTDGQLEHARTHYANKLGVPDPTPGTEPEPAAQAPTPTPQPAAQGGGDGGQQAAPAPKPEPPKARGDSEARDIAEPTWFNKFQNYCIESSVWTKDEKVVQILLTAYMNGVNGDAPANVKAFYNHIGKSEKNEQAADLHYGGDAKAGNGKTKQEAMKKFENWCQGASTAAFAQGFANCGYVFQARTLPAWICNQIGANPAARTADQGLLALAMAIQNPALKNPPNAGDKKSVSATGRGTADCWGMGAEAGDMASFVSHSTGVGANGHAVTIVSADSGDARKIRYVSGNAGSQTQYSGSIRVEEATWVPAPAGFAIKQTRPPNAGEVYIYSLTKTSKLQPNLLDQIREKEPGKLSSEYNVRYDPTLDKRQQGGPKPADGGA